MNKLISLDAFKKALERIKDYVDSKLATAGGKADWNAQAGESGYIENKPFGVEFNSVNWFYDDNASWCITPMLSNKVKYEGVIYEIPDNDEEWVELGDGSIALKKYPNYDDSIMYVSSLGISDESDERLKNILFEVNTKLDEKYLPDTALKTTPQSLSDDAKNQVKENLGISALTSDWNAQEDEAGYIKNKPFGEKYEKLEWQYSDDYGCLIAQSQTNKIFINGTEYTLRDYINDLDPDIIITINNKNFNFSYSYDEFSIISTESYTEDIDILTNNVFVYNIKTLGDKYIPDTVLKTTPQTLTDTDKNQALSNLGIDPVIWKYIYNPYEISLSDGTAEIPEDLAEVISKNLNYARLTVVLNSSGDIYFANTIGNSEYLGFTLSGMDTVYIWFDGKNVHAM